MRYLRLVIVVLVGVGVTSPAAAQGWGRGWFERWSGPGHFYGRDVRLEIGCTPSTLDRFDPPWRGRSALVADRATLCLDAEFSDYANEDNDRPKHGLISLDRLQLLAMYVVPGTRFNGGIEVGAGVGSITFRGGSFEFDRTFLPVRGVVKPFRFLGREGSRRPLLGIIQVAATLLIFPEEVRNQDFNIVPVISEDQFSHHFHPNVSVMVDFSSYLFNR